MVTILFPWLIEAQRSESLYIDQDSNLVLFTSKRVPSISILNWLQGPKIGLFLHREKLVRNSMLS